MHLTLLGSLFKNCSNLLKFFGFLLYFVKAKMWANLLFLQILIAHAQKRSLSRILVKACKFVFVNIWLSSFDSFQSTNVQILKLKFPFVKHRLKINFQKVIVSKGNLNISIYYTNTNEISKKFCTSKSFNDFVNKNWCCDTVQL